MKFEKFLKTFYVPQDDAWHGFKCRALAVLQIDARSSGREVDLADLSGVDDLDLRGIEKALLTAKQVLLAPWHQAEAMKLDAGIRGRLLVAWPFRCWGMAEKAKDFRAAGNAGELVSFRVFLNWPKGRGTTKELFVGRLLPELLDLCEYISGAEIETLHLNAADGANNVFSLAKLGGNIVAELDVNEAMPEAVAKRAPSKFVNPASGRFVIAPSRK